MDFPYVSKIRMIVLGNCSALEMKVYYNIHTQLPTFSLKYGQDKCVSSLNLSQYSTITSDCCSIARSYL